MSQHDDTNGVLGLAKKVLAPAALGVGLALTPGCGVGEPGEEGLLDEDAIELEGKEDALVNKSKCAKDYPGVKWEIFVKQKLTSSRMKKIASCAISDLVLAKECGIGCDAVNPVILYMAPPTPPPPVVRYATPGTDPGTPVALYSAPPISACATDVNWIVKPNTYLTAAKMKQLVQCADLAVDENCGIGCHLGNPVVLYSAPVARYAAPIK